MRIDRAGAPFIAGALVPAAVLLALKRPALAVPFAGLAAFMAYFFRDPERVVPTDPLVVVAPADGRVMVAGPAEPGVSPPGTWQQISIFLSPVDVHVNRAPYGGRLTRVEYRPGRFLAAYKQESALENERTELEVEAHGRRVIFRQLVGVLARRIVCRVQPGDTLQTGERFGLMKFGSRMDVFVESDARLLVRVGDRVRGGETLLARFDLPPNAA
jgi:phosphatidylserine decarboxylase